MTEILAYIGDEFQSYYRLLTSRNLQEDEDIIKLAFSLGVVALIRLSYGQIKSIKELENFIDEIPFFKLFYKKINIDINTYQKSIKIVNSIVTRKEPLEKLYYVIRDKKMRRRLGAFFTEPVTASTMATMSVNQADGKIREILDPTVGGGTLLAAVLEVLSKDSGLPDIKLRGVDVDPAALFLAYANIAYTAWKIDKNADIIYWINKNVKLSWNDYIYRYKAPKELATIADVDYLNNLFDIVIANPPWVHVNIYGRSRSKSYLSRIPRKLLLTSSDVYKDIKYKIKWPEISRSQPPIALVFLYYILKQFSKNATILVTGTILKSWNTASFRQWLIDNFDINIVEIYCKDLEETSSWPVILGVTHNLTNNIKYKVIMCKNSNRVILSSIINKKLVSPLTHPLAVGPWVTPLANGNLLKEIIYGTRELDRIGELYQLYRGINTNAAEVFIFKNIRKIDEQLVQATCISGKTVTLESDLLHVFVRGARLSNFNRGNYEYILLPHDIRTARPLPEDELKRNYPYAYKWLLKHKKLLQNRSRNPRPWYRIMDISINKIKGTKIAWRKHDIFLDFVAIPERVRTILGEKLVILDGTVYYIAEDKKIPNLYSLNHKLIKVLAWMTAKPKGGFPYREYYSWHVAMLPYDEKTEILNEIYNNNKDRIDKIIEILIK